MVNTKSFVWINNGSAKTSTTNISNLVHAIELTIKNGIGGEVYFITDDETITFKEFVTQLLSTQNLDPGSKSIPGSIARTMAFINENIWKIFGIKKAPKLIRFIIDNMSVECTINIDKAKAELKYAPLISIADGIKELRSI